MIDFFKTIKEIGKRYKMEGILLLAALGICLISLLVYLHSTIYPVQSLQTNLSEVIKKPVLPDIIYVEIAGAVYSPGVYELNKGSRVQALIEKAGGTTTAADQQYLDLYLNRALLLADQQKIFIPRSGDPYPINISPSGLPTQVSSISGTEVQADLIELNTASNIELEELPSIGPVTAQKIMAGRPYKGVEELVSKKILSASVFAKIKESIYIR